MSQRRLLMIVPFFPPNAGGGVYRPLSFVKYLPRHGWSTTVIAPRDDAYWLRDESLVRQLPEECEVIRTPVLSGQYVLSRLRGGRKAAPQVRSSRRFSWLRRVAASVMIPDSYAGWRPFGVRYAMKEMRRRPFDAIYSTSPPETSHLIAERLQAASRLPWVADFRDPWMNLYLLPPPTPLHARLHRRLENRICTRASVVVTDQWHARLLYDNYLDIDKPRIITNGYDAGEIAPYLSTEPAGTPFTIVHAGMLTQRRSAVVFLHGLRRFLDAHPEAASETRVIFVGPRESDNDRAAANLKLDDVVTFRDTVTHEESLRLQRSAHALLLIKHLDPAYAGIVPGKLYEYIGVRRPIIALVPEGEAADIVRSLNRGEVIAQNDEGAIAGCIANLFERHSAGTLDSSYNLGPVEAYERSHLAGQMANLLDELVAERAKETAR